MNTQALEITLNIFYEYLFPLRAMPWPVKRYKSLTAYGNRDMTKAGFQTNGPI